jgi:GT2 family glycosyltransferase
MKVSIVIVTKDRPSDLAHCLNSVSLQSHGCHQVIIVDSSVDNRSRSVAQRYANRLPLLYTHSQPGITKQRNIARILMADDTDIVLYIDDDVILETEIVSQLQSFFSNHVDAIGVTGNIIGEESHSFFKRLMGRISLLYTAETIGITTGIFNIINQPKKTQTVRWLPGAFMAYRWSDLSDLAFDEWFTTYGLAEDLDFSLQAAARGPIYVDPSLQVTHTHSDIGRNWQRFGVMRIRNRNYIRKKHFPGLVYWIGFWWANLWLCVFNGFRAFTSQRYRDEFTGNIRGIFSL